MPEKQPDEDDLPGRSLCDLVRTGMDDHGWTYSDLERASGRALTRGRWQQLGSGLPQRKFPDPDSLAVISRVLGVELTTVVLAAARSVGLGVLPPGPEPPRLLGAVLPVTGVGQVPPTTAGDS